MRQMACNATLEGMGDLNGCRYLLHDRDTKFCAAFRESLAAGGVKRLRLPPRSPNLNAFAERWVRSVKEECLSQLILFGERSLRKALTQFQSIIIASAIIKGRGTFCYSLVLRRYRGAGGHRSSVASASAVSSSITIAGPHEFLDHTVVCRAPQHRSQIRPVYARGLHGSAKSCSLQIDAEYLGT